ncbi:hypothetical protein [Pseudomonas sp. 21LCFQ010]|uniref:hypothetical protein n=1 Tax=Pseudomonas sp. 21LCFQ010 TaxID=2957506 RepID=UPI003453DFEC
MINDELTQVHTEHNGWFKQRLYRRLGSSAQAADLAQDTFLRDALLDGLKPMLLSVLTRALGVFYRH